MKNSILHETKRNFVPWGESKDRPATVDVPGLIHAVLMDRSRGGAVLLGSNGDGRQSAFETGFAGLQDQPQLVRLNGTDFVKHVPRGALSFLISKIDIGTEASRHELIHGLAELLCPGGIPAVVLLGHPELVDEQSASILSQLSSMKKIVLMVLCERIKELPQELLTLYRSGQLSRITMPSLDMAQARSYLEAELGGPLSTLAVATLRYLTHCNLDLMLRLLRLWIADNQLEQHGGVWVLRSGVLQSGPTLHAMLNMMLSGVQEIERKLLFVIALGGPVAIHMLHRNGMARQLDELSASGHLRIVEHPVSQAVIAVPLLSLILREAMDDDLCMTLEADLGRLHSDPTAARTRTTLLALADQGEHASLLDVAESFRETGYIHESWQQDPEHRIAILNLHVKTLLTLRRTCEAKALLMAAEVGFGTTLHNPELADRMAWAQLELNLLKAQVLTAAEGPDAAAEAEDALKELVASTEWHSDSQNYRAFAAQITGWAAHGRQLDALSAVELISRNLGSLKANGQLEKMFSAEHVSELEVMLLQAQLMSGDWHAAALRAREISGNPTTSPRIAASADAAQGILYGLLDEPERALQILEPLLQQLAFTPEFAERAAVEAVATHALVATGDNAAAIELLLKEPESVRSRLPLNFLSWVAEIFSSLAVARINEPISAHSRLLAFADKVHAAGYAGLEMQTLAVALRMGHFAVADRFEGVARTCQGPIAQRYVAIAIAVRRQDTADLAKTLEHLAESGQMLLSVPFPNALIDTIDTREQRRLATLVSRSKCQPTGVHRALFPETNSTESLPSWTKSLTKRESQVALLAIEGHGNSDIARSSGVSVRTVEGHLYQVYSKLQVRNRQELTALDRDNKRAVGQI
ncbi:helix-turn-helix transcriptional regulator [Paeniglutamicibacter gangotriensis]|uniref:helix-turn-helix transcriptional regulator n=1 Tax=Paeniglutamicibacter gangotriensis TaxID=254787 RepID=UPI00165F9F38|nr:helix-turn-helix transcriptional regulator [Paeniglutamicibacter gangotriensis]